MTTSSASDATDNEPDEDDSTPPWPEHWQADVVVADGGTVHLRPIIPEDAEAMKALHSRLSERTRYYRYFSAYSTMPARDLYRFSHVDHHDRIALGAWLGHDLIGVGRFDRVPDDPRKAEVAFVVEDDHQGRGIGSVLLEHLAQAGREVGIDEFDALVLAENRQMLRVFEHAGYFTEAHRDGSEVTVEFPIALTEDVERVRAVREQRAEAKSIQRLLFPQSIAVIGASDDGNKLGHLLMENLQGDGFAGPIYPINPGRASVAGMVAYPTVRDVPNPIDLAIVAVSRDSVLDVIEECSTKSVRGLIVVSGGFGESGDERSREIGLQAQRDLVLQARAQGMRVIGPGCLGIINSDPAVSMNATLAPIQLVRGRAGLFCQSAALGIAMLGESVRRGFGVSTFVSAGNRADVSGNDLLQYWEADPDTEVALLYLESFGNPRKFARIARRFARRKPIIAVKSGRISVAPGLAHTTVSVPDASVQALFEASGVIRTQTLDELYDVAELLLTQPLPEGDGIAVIGHSSALGLLVEDALSEAGLSVAHSSEIGYDASLDEIAWTLEDSLARDDVHCAIAIIVPPLTPGGSAALGRKFREVAAALNKPVAVIVIGFSEFREHLEADGDLHPMRGSVPAFHSPERAVTALRQVLKYAAWRRRPRGNVPFLSGIDLDGARAFVGSVLAGSPNGRSLSSDEVTRLLSFYGIEMVSEAPDEGGVETVFELRDDRSFGTLISFGVGGIATEVLNDRAYAVVPLNEVDATTLINGPKAFPLLSGYGLNEPADLHSLVNLALRLSQIGDDLPEVTECVLAPVIASSHGTFVRSARVAVAPPPVPTDLIARRMSNI